MTGEEPPASPTGGADRMRGYILNRLVGMVAVMFIVVTIVFIIVRVAPGDPAAVMLGPDATAGGHRGAARPGSGLDQPMPVQYVIFSASIAQGDLGQSIFLNRPVLQAIAERAEPTSSSPCCRSLIAAAIALPVGIASAVWRGARSTSRSLTLAMLAASIPSFWLGLLLISLRGASRLVPGRRLRRAGRRAPRPHAPSGAAGDRARASSAPR